MEPKKKILILMADAGFGHRSAAVALERALNELYGESVQTEIVNPLDDKRAPFFLRESQTDYDRWIKNFPELYKLGYEASDALVPKYLMEQTLSGLLLDVMRDLLRKSEPDAIISTYPLYQAAMTAILGRRKHKIPFYTVITDLSTVHRMWFNNRVTGLFVPNRHVAELAMNYGLPAEKIIISGIPVHPDVASDARTKSEIREELGLEKELTTILAVSSRRVEHMLDSLNVINHFGIPLQLIVVAGKDDDLFQAVSEMEWHIPVKLYNFVENMPTLMHASDIILCKAGGLIVTESLACGLPMILIDVIPGQETGNAEYVLAYGAGDIAETPIQLLELLSHWMLNDCGLYKRRAQNARAIGLPKSAYTVAEVLWQVVNHLPPPAAPHRRTRRRIIRQVHPKQRKSIEELTPIETSSEEEAHGQL